MVKNLPANAGDARAVSSIPGLGRFPRGGNGNSFQYSCLGNPMDTRVWWVESIVHGVAKNETHLSAHVHITEILNISSFNKKRHIPYPAGGNLEVGPSGLIQGMHSSSRTQHLSFSFLYHPQHVAAVPKAMSWSSMNQGALLMNSTVLEQEELGKVRLHGLLSISLSGA